MLKTYIILFVFFAAEHCVLVLNGMESPNEETTSGLNASSLRELMGSVDVFGISESHRDNNETTTEQQQIDEFENQLLIKMSLGELKPLLVTRDIARALMTFGFPVCSLNTKSRLLYIVTSPYDLKNNDELFYVLLSTRKGKLGSQDLRKLAQGFLEIAQIAALYGAHENTKSSKNKGDIDMASDVRAWSAISYVTPWLRPNLDNAFVIHEVFFRLAHSMRALLMSVDSGDSQIDEFYWIKSIIKLLRPYSNIFLEYYDVRPDDNVTDIEAAEPRTLSQEYNALLNKATQERILAAYKTTKFLGLSISPQMAHYLMNNGYPVFKMVGKTVEDCVQITKDNYEKDCPFVVILLQREAKDSLHDNLIIINVIIGELVTLFDMLKLKGSTGEREAWNTLRSIVLRLKWNDYNSFILYQLCFVILKSKYSESGAITKLLRRGKHRGASIGLAENVH